MNIQKALDAGRTPGSVVCPKCQQVLFAPTDKISISLYGGCTDHVEDDKKIANLFELANAL